jgi:sugar phosphate isomerase/epimerase
VYKLLSISDDPWTIGRLGGLEAVAAAIRENGFDGIELMRWHDPLPVPGVRAVGRHMPYWPTCLDFLRGDERELLWQFDSMDNARQYYSAASRVDFVRQRRAELEEAAAMGAEYAVFHVAHAQMEHCYTRRFTYTDAEIVQAFADLINEVMEGFGAGVALLFENHWFPGLKLTDRAPAEALMAGISYPRKGFVLDISHMMLAEDAITEPDAVDAILKNVERLGDLAKSIRAVHLNSAAGAQPLDMRYPADAPYETRLAESFRYVGSMDPHRPFLHDGIRRVIEAVNPEYLVYELVFDSAQQLSDIVRKQDKALKARCLANRNA